MGDCYITRRGGGSTNKTTVIITISSGTTSIVATASSTGKKKNAFYRSKDDTWILSGLDNDTWTILATKNTGETSVLKKTYTRPVIDYLNMAYRVIPKFTCTGYYDIVQDDDTPIGPGNSNTGEQFDTYRGHWKIRFYDPGTLTITDYAGWDGHADIFLVGAGGGSKLDPNPGPGGGGGGYTLTVSDVQVPKTNNVVVGKGQKSKNGESSSFNSFVAKGGGAASVKAGNGGSGGGCYHEGRGGSDGSDGTGTSKGNRGIGQHKTTREFGEPTGKLYSGGGAAYNGTPGEGGGGKPNENGKPNTGGGGGAFVTTGGSGIVIMRDHRVPNELTKATQEIARLENEKAQLATSYREGVNSV